MARIATSLPEYDVTFDVSSNPELIHMAIEGDDEFDVTESQWLAMQYVTKPKHSNYDKE